MPDIFIAEEIKDKVQKKEGVEKTKDSKKHFYLLHSFFENPEGVSFEDLEEDEKILLFLRRHFITNIHWVLITLLLCVIPILIFPFSSRLPLVEFLNLPLRFTIVLTIFYYLLVVTYLFVNYITWYFNIALITNKRIIDVNFADLVYKNVSATKIDLIEDVSYKQVGVMGSFFDYGDVLLQTAGSVDNFIFQSAHKPEKVIQLVERLIGRKNA